MAEHPAPVADQRTSLVSLCGHNGEQVWIENGVAQDVRVRDDAHF
jgi:hypothetical protein